MIYLLNWRLWVGAAFLVLLPILYVKGRTDGARLERAGWTARMAQAADNAREVERLRQRGVDVAQVAAAAREARLAADAARARDAAGGLRDATELAERVATESGAAADQARRALGIVVNQCGARLTEVAADADVARSEASELRQAWPQ